MVTFLPVAIGPGTTNVLQVMVEIHATRSATSVSGLRLSLTTRCPAGIRRHVVVPLSAAPAGVTAKANAATAALTPASHRSQARAGRMRPECASAGPARAACEVGSRRGSCGAGVTSAAKLARRNRLQRLVSALALLGPDPTFPLVPLGFGTRRNPHEGEGVDDP